MLRLSVGLEPLAALWTTWPRRWTRTRRTPQGPREPEPMSIEPVDRDDRTRRGGDLAGRLAEQGVEGVALTFVDTAGHHPGQGRAAGTGWAGPPAWGVGMSPVFDTFVSDDCITSTDVLGGPDGDLRLVPDLDRLTVLAAQPGWAWAPVDRYTQDGERYPACQRLFARRMVERPPSAG